MRKKILIAPSAASIDAEVFGDWAAHPSHDGSGGWSVTHVPSGCAIRKNCDRRQALRAAEILDAEALGESLPSFLITPGDVQLAYGLLLSERYIDGIFHALYRVGL